MSFDHWAHAPIFTLPALVPATQHPPAVTQQEADAIASVLNTDDVACIEVHWVRGYGSIQALLQPIKAKWLGYVMMLVILIGTRAFPPAWLSDPSHYRVVVRSRDAYVQASTDGDGVS